MNSPKKSKLILLLLLATFALPVIIAKLILEFKWYQGGSTNHGQLITQENISYQSLAVINPFPKHWQIIYLVPNICNKSCKNQLYLLQQTYTALGKERDRVIAAIAVTNKNNLQKINTFKLPQFIVKPNMISALGNHLIIVDPLGKMVMRYDDISDEQLQQSQSKALLMDLKKMLKLSRIG